MQFLFPSFLWALAALAIPVIIHLFYFRKFKKVQFTNVRMLQEIKEETSSRNRLKDLLILLSRLLVLAFLILAFAQPFIARGEEVKTGSNAVSIFVDNSFSMNAVRGQTPILQIAKQKARDILQAYSESDNFQILTHDFEGRHQRLVSKEDALSLIDEIELTARVRDLANVINRQKQVLSREDANHISYLLSDFQESITPSSFGIDSTLELNLVPLQAIQENNISIDSAWLEAGVAFRGQSNKLLVTISNYGEENVENVRLSILKDNQEKPEGQLSIPAGQSITDTINISILESGWHTAEIKISDFPVQFDDSYFISFYVDENIRVLNINSGTNNRYLGALFNGLSNFEVTTSNTGNINYGELSTYQLVIVHDLNTFTTGMASAFKNYVESGGKLLLFPQPQMNNTSFNAFLTSMDSNIFAEWETEDKSVSTINTDEFVFKDVFSRRARNMTLPKVSGSYHMSSYQNRLQENLLSFRDGRPFLMKMQRENGILYVCSSPLNSDYNNLVLNAEIFVPMLFKMAIAKARYEPISFTIGGNQPIEVTKNINTADLVYTLVGKTELIPSQINLGSKVLLNENGQIEEAGIYRLEKDNQLEKQVAFNYNRTESDLTIGNLKAYTDEANIIDQTLTADFTTLVSEKDKGVVLWKWCLILALIFLAIEALLLRYWKNSNTRS